jgi:signal transduction histidine kinase
MPYRREGSFGRIVASMRDEDPAALAEHLRAIYRDYLFNSPLACSISLYLYLARTDIEPWPFLRTWVIGWVAYLIGRFVAGLVFSLRQSPSARTLPFWSRLSILIQALDGLFVTALALFIYPELDPLAQSAVLAATLVLVGATVFSLASRWISILVYAPPVYLSFAWMTWNQGHPYAQGFAAFTLAMFVLYLIYAGNQRKSVLKGFELAKLNGQLADQLQAKNAELQEVAAGRSRLLATVSHDLRQPAHAIGLLAERAMCDSSPVSTRQSLRDLNELSQSLSASLITLMDLTRLDAGLVEPNKASLSLEQVFKRLEAEFQAAALSKGLLLLVRRTPQWIRSDPVLLHGLLANLVSNAIKYTAHGMVELTSTLEGDRVRVSVVDTGVGIRSDKLEVIFKEFVRLDASESGTEGLGLGLSIVKRYALLLDHRLSVESTPGKGSRFSVWLPLTDPMLGAGTLEDAADQAQVQLANLRVMVVDNVDLLLSSMIKTLSGWGCEVASARNMVEALEASRNRPVDLLISDYHLGDLEPNGLQLIQTLRARADRALPALLMTGDVSAQLEASAHQQGVRVLHKPVRPQVLREQVLELLEQARSAQ